MQEWRGPLVLLCRLDISPLCQAGGKLPSSNRSDYTRQVTWSAMKMMKSLLSQASSFTRLTPPYLARTYGSLSDCSIGKFFNNSRGGDGPEKTSGSHFKDVFR